LVKRKGGKMKDTSRILLVMALIACMGFATTIVIKPPCAKLRGDEPLQSGYGIPYLGNGRQSPGDQIGTSWYDFQANGSLGQRLKVDDGDQAHIDWMKRNEAGDLRYCAWNFRYADGSYYGETQASPSWSGYVQLDITTDADLDDQRTVIAYHYDPGTGITCWIDIDAGNGWGNWPNDPKSVGAIDHTWPYIGYSQNGNITLVEGDGVQAHYLYNTTDDGENWSPAIVIDSCGCLSQFVCASQNSNKVAHVWTQFINEVEGNDQLVNDVYYMISTDGGVNWGAPINITNFPNSGTLVEGDSQIYAYANVNAIFDNNDDLHIAWAGHLVYVSGGTMYLMLYHSKIFHWDEVSTTHTQINPPSPFYPEIDGGWWLDGNLGTGASGRAGAWRMSCDQPQLVLDQANGDLYCLWHGNADTTDFSAAMWMNCELYGNISRDNGATWMMDTLVNLTNTAGAASGDCLDEDYMTANPFIVNDSVFITYLEDKDAGSYPHGEGAETENPIRCWVFSKHKIGIEEFDYDKPQLTTMNVYPNPAVHHSKIAYVLSKSSNVSIQLFDVAGRLVKNLDSGYKEAGEYNLSVNTNDLANGTYFVILKTATEKSSRTLVVVK
jgi:hypothetical protein